MALNERIAVDFTDGDTYKRFSVAAIDVTATSNILCSCIRPSDLPETTDPGWTFHPTVVNIYAGGFDVAIDVMCAGEPASLTGENNLNETVWLIFTIF